MMLMGKPVERVGPPARDQNKQQLRANPCVILIRTTHLPNHVNQSPAQLPQDSELTTLGHAEQADLASMPMHSLQLSEYWSPNTKTIEKCLVHGALINQQ